MKNLKKISAQAKLYLGVMSARLFIIGSLALFVPTVFGSCYGVITSILPLGVWGVIMLAISLGTGISILLDKSKVARMFVVAAATVTGFWAFSLIGAWMQGSLNQSIDLVVWFAIAVKDLVVASIPFSTPVENLLREKPHLAHFLTDLKED